MATTTGGSSASLGSSRMPGSLGSVSSAELGSPSLDSISADSSPMHHRSGATPAVASTSASTPVVGATVDESTNGSREDFDADEEKDVDKSVASKEKRKDSGSVFYPFVHLSLFLFQTCSLKIERDLKKNEDPTKRSIFTIIIQLSSNRIEGARSRVIE